MEYSKRTRTVSSLVKDISKGLIDFDHPLQRKEDQWNREQQSLLIDSLIKGYPLYPFFWITTEKEETYKYEAAVLDGKQRLLTIYNYVSNGFSLSKKIQPVTFNDTEYDIAKLRFSRLPEELKDKIINSELEIYRFTKWEVEEIRELFNRYNNGVPLTKNQKMIAYMDEDFSSRLHELLQHPFFEKTAMSKSQLKKDEDRAIGVQLLMVTNGYDFSSFDNKEFLRFFDYYKQNLDDHLFDQARTYLDKLDAAVSEKKKNLKKINIVPAFAGIITAISNNKEEEYTIWLDNFFENYDSHTEYRELCNGSTTKKENVLGRIRYFQNAVS